MSRRLSALVIGNAAYETVAELKNPANDAEDVGQQLEASGFSVIQKTDCDHADMDRALRRFKRDLDKSDVGLFFFAGHGMQIDGENYLAAIDTDATDEVEAKHSSLSLNRVIDVMEKSKCSTSIIILDACRDNPFERAWRRAIQARGLAPVYAPKGTLIAFATSPGQTADDGRGRNGAYTQALLQHLATPDCSIETMFKRVRNSLSAATRGRQISWEHTSLAGEFYFNLSLGTRIDLYSEMALSDSLFVLDEAKATHRVIRGLKSLTWPRQNPAVADFTATVANRGTLDSLFVVGRNFYQAACGGSHAAQAYLSDFASRASGLKLEKRKAVLDGMLFEVFFDSNGQLRKSFKLRQFKELFALQRHKDLQPSFDFLAECLLPQAQQFYVVPGKRQEVAVDVVTKPSAKADHHIVVSLHCGGESILWLEDDDYLPEAGEPPMRQRVTLEAFEALVAEQMVVAPQLLKLNYQSFKKSGREQMNFPRGWTARKR
ncbi:MAG: caspase family protein [Proteobacteria bacterium]|nr:caspase family protein [Pseudomonadota bacterium]